VPRHLRILIILAVLSLILRVVGLVVFGPIVTRDSADYTIPALNVASGEDYFRGLEKRDVLRTPGYPVFLASVYAVFGENNLVVAILQQLMVVLAAIFVFVVGRKVVGELPGLIGAAVFLLNPYMILFPNFILSEPVSILTLSLLLWLLILAMERDQSYYFFWSGLLLGYHILCRPPEQLLPLLVLVPLVIKYKSFKRILRPFLLMILGVALLVLPWLVYNYARTGNVGFTPLLGRNLALKVAHHTSVTLDLPPSVEVDSVIEKRGKVWEASNALMQAGYSREEVDRIYLQGAMRVVKRRPLAFLLWQLQELWEFWRGYDLQGFVRVPRPLALLLTTAVGLVMLALFLIGLYRFQINFSSTLVILTIAYFALLVPLAGFGSTRFRYPVEPYIWIYAANGLLILFSSVRKRSGLS
jgi:4-amino-4-deoxy-L-arabinose transferase-like glycosyltransferase